MSEQNNTPVETVVPVVEVVETSVPTPAPAPTTNKVTAKPTQAPKALTHKEIVEKYLLNADVNRQFLISTLEEYIRELAPRKVISDKNGANLQMRLWTTIKNLVNRDQSYDEFKTTWNVILSYYRQYGDERDVLGMRYSNRFFHEWPGTFDDSICFQLIIQLLQITVEPDQDRRARAMRLVNLDRCFPANIFTDEARQRVFQYYKV